MLIRVLKEIETNKGPVRLQELSQKLNIEPAVLDGMLEYWIRKGRVKKSDGYSSSCGVKSCGQGCHSCVVSAG